MTDSHADYEPGVLRVFRGTAETKAFYNKIAKVYDFLAEESEGPMRDQGLAMLAPKPGETMLEIGFGTGHCLAKLADAVGPTGKVLGIDLSDGMLEHARQLLKEKNVAERVELFCGDAAQLPFAPESLDGIFTNFTLELFDTPEMPGVLANWKQALKPGGRLQVVSISKEGPPSLMGKAFEWTHQHFPNLMDCRPIFAGRALEAAGFTIADQKIASMWAPVEIALGVAKT